MGTHRTTALCIALALGAAGIATAQTPSPAPPSLFSLTSSGFPDGGVIPDTYSAASSAPVSPPLAWTDVPPGTVSFALIAHDPDTAPQHRSGDFLHWLAFNIPGTARSLHEGVPGVAQLPDGTIQCKNSAGAVGFRPLGARGVYHHYTFELYALDTKLSLGPDATRADVLQAMDGHVLAKAAYEGRFHR